MNQLSTKQEAIVVAKQILSEKSKSFALAAKVLPRQYRDDMAILYAFCRYVDDEIDLVPREQRPEALRKLRAQLDAIYHKEHCADPVLAAFSWLVHEKQIPRQYPEELLAGMEMDVLRVEYQTVQDLELYCYRVAGVVGLMSCHVIGIRDEWALKNAAHLGIAMQLTNICRDVEEDLADGRVYLPKEMLGFDLKTKPEENSAQRWAVKSTVEQLLSRAETYYRSADKGLVALGYRSAVAISVARFVYSAIGSQLRNRQFDPFFGRVVVPTSTKLLLVIKAVVLSVFQLPSRFVASKNLTVPHRVVGFPHDVLPI